MLLVLKSINCLVNRGGSSNYWTLAPTLVLVGSYKRETSIYQLFGLVSNLMDLCFPRLGRWICLKLDLKVMFLTLFYSLDVFLPLSTICLLMFISRSLLLVISNYWFDGNMEMFTSRLGGLFPFQLFMVYFRFNFP